MRYVLAGFACAVVPAVAAAGPALPTSRTSPTSPTSVIGGSDVAAGTWPDVGAVLFSIRGTDLTACTGTLIAPTVVLTAGHCDDTADPPLPDNVLIGTSSLARPSEGETISVARGIPFPDAASSEDVAVLVLSRPSTRAPRPIATGWARLDLVNGAAISLVGFGAVNKTGDRFIAELQEATTTITDADCSTSEGCNPAAQPAGELGAGGMGIDTCPGDSGGPLYLKTRYGTFLAGVTSRGYSDATVSCSEGGIYERPDKIVDWIESVAGVPVARGPEPTADPIVALPGDGGQTQIAVNDPKSTAHSFAITTPPAHATAGVRGDGAVGVCVDPAAAPGDDALTVTISDRTHPERAVSLPIAIHITEGSAQTRCDLAAFDTGDSGCDAGGAGGGAVPLAIGALVLATRRRALSRASS